MFRREISRLYAVRMYAADRWNSKSQKVWIASRLRWYLYRPFCCQLHRRYEKGHLDYRLRL